MDEIMNSKQLREMIRIMERRVGVLRDSEFSCCGITIAQCHALVEIGRVQSIALNELAELLNLENSTVSKTVNNLVVGGLAKRDIDPQDRRYVSISLTENGQELFERIEDDMNQYFRKVFTAIPEDKREQVLESMQLLLQALEQYECCK